MSNVFFDNPNLSMEDILGYFSKLDDLTIAGIETRINLNEYATKLSNYAKILRLNVERTVVGIIFYYENNYEIYITHLSVLPEHRNIGYASQMLGQLSKSSRLPIKLEVAIDNQIARKLYETLGFLEVSADGNILVMETSPERNYLTESRDNSNRSYRYSVDALVRQYFLERMDSLGFLNNENPCLEVGSHDGSMTAQLLGYFKEIEVIEPVVDFHEKLREEFGTRILVHSGITSDFEFTGKFKSIFLVHVLEHMDDPVVELSRLGRWLSPGGSLFVLVPNADALSRQIAMKMGIMKDVQDVLPGEKMQGHLRTYNKEMLLNHAESAGLVVSHAGGILRKPLANFQLDSAIQSGIISLEYLEALNELSKSYPADSSSIYIVAKSPS
jgi:GNAT superfamily N-acetyltransferase